MRFRIPALRDRQIRNDEKRLPVVLYTLYLILNFRPCSLLTVNYQLITLTLNTLYSSLVTDPSLLVTHYPEGIPSGLVPVLVLLDLFVLLEKLFQMS